MPKALIVYSSHEGQTAKIAHEIAGGLRFADHEVDVRRCQDAPAVLDPAAYDLVLAGSPIHAGTHDRLLIEWLRANRTALSKTTSGFFSVSLAAASQSAEENEEARHLARDAVKEAGCEVDAIVCFAGALSYSQYGFVKKLIMRHIAGKEGGDTDTTHDYEYTDWNSVRDFAQHMAEIAHTTADQTSPPSAHLPRSHSRRSTIGTA